MRWIASSPATANLASPVALFANICLLGCCAGLLLAAQCGSAPAQSGPPATRPVAAEVLADEPVAASIWALLDTATAGSADRADEHLDLQAGVAVRAFYGTTGAPAWVAADSLGPDATAALALLAQAPAHGLRPTDYGSERLLLLRDSLARPAESARRARQ